MQADFNRPVLAVDTGTSYLSLALRADGETRLFHQEAGSRQSEWILPQIRTLFHDAGITAADLGAIVYAKGPGAFTGLRIGIGVAQGLATPFDTPLIGIPTLDAVCNPSAWTQRQFKSALVSPSEQVWLVEQNNTLSAFIVWQNLPGESELHLIAAAPECRRRVSRPPCSDTGPPICPSLCCLTGCTQLKKAKKETKLTDPSNTPWNCGSATFSLN